MQAETTKQENSKVLNTNPKRFILGGVLIICIFFGGLGIWSVFFPFQGAVIASGTVKVSGERKTVQHLEGGIIDAILVNEGQKVTKGQVLIRLKSSKVNASVDLLQGQLWAKLAESARLSAESTMQQEIDWPGQLLSNQDNPEVRELIQKQKDIFESRRTDIGNKISLYRSQIEQIKNKIAGANEEITAQQEIIANLKEELQAKEELFKDEYIDKVQLLELRRMLSEHKGRAGKLRQSIAESRQKIEEIKLRIVDIKNTYREKAVTKLGEVNNQIFELRERIRPQLDAKKRLKITAPVSGEVINLQVTSEGSGVIKAGQPLLDIVPTQSNLIVEAWIQLTDITDVKKGQSTKVQLSAFNRRSTPPIPGKVTYVSADQLTRETPRGPQSYYVAHVRIDSQDLEEHNAYLAPGMPAVCYITTDKRTVIGYLLDPIFNNLDQALREG
jgi:HlyD family type I secretion membrane fusion protein